MQIINTSWFCRSSQHAKTKSINVLLTGGEQLRMEANVIFTCLMLIIIYSDDDMPYKNS
jgi:hypothetical protein